MRKRTLTIDGNGTIFSFILDTLHINNKRLTTTLSVYYDMNQKCLIAYSVGQPVIKIEEESI